MHVQKDRCGALGSHMEKCIFLDYPPDYKGWKFYNSDTKRIIVSEHAVFDERYFPCLKNWSSVPLYHTVPPSPPVDTALNPPLDDGPLLAVPELPLPHLEGEEPAPGHANVLALLAVPE
jgi:hypothetical protein